MELRALESFVAVAEELHFHRAAGRLHLTQPALTRHIRRLEAELGVELLRRNSRRVELTQAGVAFLEEVRVVLARAERARRVVRQVGAGELGRLTVGHVDGAAYVVLPPVLRQLRSEYGEVSAFLTELESNQLLTAVCDGELDVVFTRTEASDPLVQSLKILDERVAVALPAGHRLTAEQSVPLGALADEDLVMFGRHSSPVAFGLIDDACRRSGFSPRIREEIDAPFPRLVLVAAGIGVTLDSEALARYAGISGVEWRPLTDSPIVLPLYVYWRTDDQRKTTARLVELFTAEAAAQFPAPPPASIPKPQPGEEGQ